jgi:osmoprotectant transport system permease protein
MYRAVADGTVDVITAFSSDGRIARYNLKVLADPKGSLPPYDAVLLLGPRNAAALAPVLAPLVNAISLQTMQKANLMADPPPDSDTPKKTPAEVGAWLTQSIPSSEPSP